MFLKQWWEKLSDDFLKTLKRLLTVRPSNCCSLPDPHVLFIFMEDQLHTFCTVGNSTWLKQKKKLFNILGS